MIINNLSIRYKLLLSFIAIALLAIPFNIYLMIHFGKATKNLTDLTDYHLPSLQALVEMKNTMLRVNLFISNFNQMVNKTRGNESPPSAIGATKDELLSYLGEIDEWQKAYQKHLMSNQGSINELNSLKNMVILKALDVFAAKENNLGEKEIRKRITALEAAQTQLERLINNELINESEALQLTRVKTINAFDLLRALVIITNSFVLVMACFIGFFLSRWISNPIITLRNFTHTINQDNLGLRTQVRGHDEISDLAISINQMLENLDQARTQIIEASRLAGVAEVATSVIHNVGNLLNSVNTSIALITEIISQSKVVMLIQMYDLIDAHKDDLDSYLITEKGKLVLPYFKGVLQALDEERRALNKELNYLKSNLYQIKQVVSSQLSSEISVGIVEVLDVGQLLNDALQLQNKKINDYHIRVEKNYTKLPPFHSVKSKLQQITVNLIKNAVESLAESEHSEKWLKIGFKMRDSALLIHIEDNGAGILQENLDRIFSFGFTTKKKGHGYGLHSCALLAKELGGQITVHSEGLHQGAVFVLTIPDLLQTK